MTHSQQRARKVAVIGAGMGGLAVAIALRKIGLEVRVFEQSSQFSPVGICLSVFPNGHRALAALSARISARIRERGHELPTLCIRKPSGEVIAEKPHDFEARFGLPLMVIRWSSLQDVLRDELRPILTRAPLAVMHKGRFAILGDAAHAMQLSSGQGANLSFEDAFELAQCLATHVSWTDALEAFSARRVPRAQVVHARNALVSNKAHSADAHDFMKGVVERAQLNEAEFQQYLHSYVPGGGWLL